jgi:AAA15 family ATPase/GTPase
MQKLNIPLGKKITVIAGQNATCKSTLLGMIGQPFGLKNEYTIFNKPFSTKFSEIFKFSPTYDLPGEHEYQIEFYDKNLFGNKIEYIKSYQRAESDKSHIRLVVGKTREKGKGNLDYPVIYLGLKRTYPIGELNTISESNPTLNETEKSSFNNWYKNIFYPLEDISPIQITSKQQKDTLVINSINYDYFANSAGQDNIGQILGSIISFQRLKEKLGNEYHGGLMLIDEFDVTLFSKAQTSLIDLLYKMAGKLDIQFVFTTHSICAIEHIIKNRQKLNNETTILHITRQHGPIEINSNPTLNDIMSDFNITTQDEKCENKKINVYCEDMEAIWLIKHLLISNLKKNISIKHTSFSAGSLIELANNKLPEFKNSIFVVDGDQRNIIKKKSLNPNILFLPGQVNPENLFRLHLTDLQPNDKFWYRENQYTKQVFLRELSEQTNGQYTDRNLMKKWFNHQKTNKRWGKYGIDLYKSWSAFNQDVITSFETDFKKVFNLIAKRTALPPLK